MENCDLCLNVDTFNLKYTLECGQCFRWNMIEPNIYIGVIADRVIKIKQEGNRLYIWSNNKENLEQVVRHYFDLNKDYKSVEKDISKIDTNVSLAVRYSSGIRILNQPLFETFISYIISANNNIKRISRSVNDISQKYGKEVIFEGKKYYLFPSCKELKKCTVEDFLKCGLGFRSKYVVHNIEKLSVDENLLDCVKNLDTELAKKELLKFMGVGPKVADCILLFALQRSEVFPVDVWVKKIMEKLYFKQNTSIKTISRYAKDNFKTNCGIIQQHLFYNVREGKM